MRVRQLAVLVAAVFGLCAGPAARAGDKKEVHWSKIREVSRKGAFSISLRDKFSLRVPTGYRLVTEDKLDEYHELMGDTPVPGEVGVLLPEDGGWVAVISFPAEDPLKGQDPKQLSNEALLTWNEKGLEDARPKRTARGLPELKVTGWTHKPAYDAETKRLTMGMRVAEEGDRANAKRDQLHYKTLIYNPDGAFVCLQTITGIGNWDKPLEETKKLASEFGIPLAGEGSTDDPLYYPKIVGAGVIGVVLVIILAKLIGGQRTEAVPARPAARRFGTPR